MAQKDFSYLGWNPIEIYIGHSLFDLQEASTINPGFQIGAIRNCSYAQGLKYVGITAEDRTNGGQVLAIYEQEKSVTNILLRQEYILYHSLDRSATKICFTQPSKKGYTADLFLLPINEKQPYLLLEGVLAQDTIPNWFPGGGQVTYHTPEGTIEILDIEEKKRTVVEMGQSPTVSPDGEKVAFHRNNELFTWCRQTSYTENIQMRRQLFMNHLSGGISWSPDGIYLCVGINAGIVGKQTYFYLLEIQSGHYWKTKMKYLNGLLLL